jgi:hypothetical protein
MKSMFSFDETFTGGFPVKSSEATANTLDGKAYRVGYQTAKLESDRQQFAQEQMLFEQQKAAVIQQLLNAQAQLASSMGAQAAMQSSPAMGQPMGAPPPDMGMGGGMPPGMPPMGPEMGGAPPPGPSMGGGMPPMM